MLLAAQPTKQFVTVDEVAAITVFLCSDAAKNITGANISQCLTRYSCSWISMLPPQVIQRQTAEVDYVSGATQSSNAFYYAIVEALKQAK